MDKYEKIASPVEHYDNPIDVDKDSSLSKEEKITLLQNWLDDINLRQTADAENMPGHVESRYRIAEIKQLLSKYLIWF